MEVNKLKTVADVVSENYKAADVFKKYGIDFCCGGGHSLVDVCDKKGIDYTELENDLSVIDAQTSKSSAYEKWDLDFLIDFIVQKHHTYVIENIPLILEYSNKVARVHGINHPETLEINELFRDVAIELMDHMKKEETILFPMIEKIARSENGDSTVPETILGTIQFPIQAMKHEHENVGNAFKKIAQLTSDYTPPQGACNTYMVLYAKLQEFETDLHQHIHLENNILFPKAIKLQHSICDN